MSTTYIVTASLFVLIFATGIWTSLSGRPLNVAVNTIHKLISVGTGIFIVRTLILAHHSVPLTPVQVLLVAITGLCLVATVATGGFLSSDKAMPHFVLLLHQVMPVLTTLGTGVVLFSVLGR